MKKYICMILIICLTLLCSCSYAKAPQTAAPLQAMDTVMTMTVYSDEYDICNKLADRISRLDDLLDATDENSEIYKLNRDKTVTVSSDTELLLNKSLNLCEKLNGYFDITVYPAILEWGFTTGDYKIPDEAALAALTESIDYRLAEVNGSSVTVPEPVMLDLGAVAKGYAADCCLDILSESKATAAVLNLGGTIALYGEKPDGSPFRVGIADPDNSASYFGYLSCGEGVISTSGGYERYFERDGKRYIHILDPKTAEPVDNGILSVTVISDSGTTADAMSTAIFVMGLDKARDYYKTDFKTDGGRDFIILTQSGDLYITDGVYDSFIPADGYNYHINKLA